MCHCTFVHMQAPGGPRSLENGRSDRDRIGHTSACDARRWTGHQQLVRHGALVIFCDPCPCPWWCVPIAHLNALLHGLHCLDKLCVELGSSRVLRTLKGRLDIFVKWFNVVASRPRLLHFLGVKAPCAMPECSLPASRVTTCHTCKY